MFDQCQEKECSKKERKRQPVAQVAMYNRTLKEIDSKDHYTPVDLLARQQEEKNTREIA